MSENPQVQPPYKSKTYTPEQIKDQLMFISSLLPFADGRDRKILIRRANEWLDKSNEVTEGVV